MRRGVQASTLLHRFFISVLSMSEASVVKRLSYALAAVHVGEISARALKIPCVSSCAGATRYITTGQIIVVDAGRGEVYDAKRLQNYD